MKEHKKKLKKARKMMSKEEISNGVSVWDSKAWQAQKAAKLTKQVSAYMSTLGKKGIASTLAKDPQHLEKMRANSLKTRQANKKTNDK